jgi:hypothetical protein
MLGMSFSVVEAIRVKALVNRRAQRAYRASNYWTRFLKIGEERAVTSGVMPYTEAGLSSVDTFLRIFKQAPYISSSVQEFDFTVTADGATLVAGDLDPSSAFLTYKAQFADAYGDGAGETSSVPAEWFQYLAHGTYADYLRAGGQQEKAALADQEAEALLTEELIRLDENHTSGFVSNRIRTNANMQLRW